MKWCLIISFLSQTFFIINCNGLYSQDNPAMPYRQFVEIEQSSGLSDNKQYSDLNECEVFCLQPDIRLCQCSKEELNKYITIDFSNQKQGNRKDMNMTLPHIYQSAKEKNTCGEYSIIIRKLNIAMQRLLPSDQKDFYFEPSLDFQVDSPSNHSVSNLFFWGDWIALYSKNPYTELDSFIPGCIWQIPSLKNSYYSTITVPECRYEILKMLKYEITKIHLCIWAYDRYWYDKNSGPCLCCELNFNDCHECYQCFKNNKLESDDKLNDCLLSDRKNLNNDNLSCYKCLNVINPTFNCQSYEQFLARMIEEYKGHNKNTNVDK